MYLNNDSHLTAVGIIRLALPLKIEYLGKNFENIYTNPKYFFCYFPQSTPSVLPFSPLLEKRKSNNIGLLYVLLLFKREICCIGHLFMEVVSVHRMVLRAS